MNETENSNFFCANDDLEVTLESGETVIGKLVAVNEEHDILALFRVNVGTTWVKPIAIRRIDTKRNQWYFEDGMIAYYGMV